MKVKTIAVNYERKINTGNYSSATVGCSIWADIEMDENGQPAEDVQTAFDGLWELAKANVKAQILPIVNAQAVREKEA